MPKVDWITWKTDPKELLNPDKYMDMISSKLDGFQIYMNSVVVESIRHEMEKGGLDRSSFTVSSLSPMNEKAQTVLNKIEECKEEINQYKVELKKSLEEQKQIEKSQLIEAIEKKMEEEQKILDNMYYLNNHVDENTVIDKKQVEEVVELSEERMKRLQERLELAKAL